MSSPFLCCPNLLRLPSLYLAQSKGYKVRRLPPACASHPIACACIEQHSTAQLLCSDSHRITMRSDR